MVALVVTPVAPWLAGLISYLASLGTWVIELIAITFADLPVAYFPWATGLPATILSILLIMGIAAWLRAGALPLRQLGVAATVVIAVSTISVPAASEILPKSWPLKQWEVVACDVGQGDAIVIQSQGRTALIDVGSDENLINQCLTELSVNQIDLLVLTHFDFDHVGGLAGALKSRKISSAIISGFPDDRPATAISLKQLEDAGVSVTIANPSISGLLGEYSWQILAPTKLAEEAKDSNDASVVMIFKGPKLDLLLLGDLGESGQERIASVAQKILNSSTRPLVLKVSHHGSNDQFPDLYESLRPELSLISVGATNGYGHPGKQLLELLERSGSMILRTDLHGSIAVSATSNTLSWAGSG
jgi:competence protein ComEC